ncbi:MAG TPA: HAMP domain-containing sensor histidine kinase, partial [Deinococcales bacterium]|nr:HAMP domain-containing sensor histidine kinase [Deinococcales bacterium]
KRETDFTRYASHELRTPLTAMRAQLDALENGWETPEEALPEVRAQVTRMTDLTGALLLLAREGETNRAPADLAEVVRSAAARAGAAYRGPERLPADLDPVLVTRALENLLENAARYAPGQAPSVTLSAGESSARVTVEDRGPGVPPEVLGRLSEAFYRVPGRPVPGNGLGLAVARRIAEAHGGGLSFENAAPSGLRATLSLERFAPRPAPARAGTAPAAGAVPVPEAAAREG